MPFLVFEIFSVEIEDRSKVFIDKTTALGIKDKSVGKQGKTLIILT